MSKNKKKPKPNLDRPVTMNPAEAEAADFNIYFTWRGLAVVIDVKTLVLVWALARRRPELF